MSEEAHPIAGFGEGERGSILIHGLGIFALTGGLVLCGVSRLQTGTGYTPSASVSAPYFLAVFFLMTLLLLAGLRIIKRGVIFEILFTLALLSGSWFLADIFLPGGLPIVVGSIVILLRFWWKSILSQNLTLVVGIAGFSVALGTDLSPNAVLIVLTVLVFYDIVAVYKTHHMVRMFRDLIARGVLFAFALTPLEWRHLKACPTGKETPPAMLLGTGDVALPAMLAASVSLGHLGHGVGVMVGTGFGFALMYRFFLTQHRKRPIPALPPIALGAVIGYFLSLLIF